MRTAPAGTTTERAPGEASELCAFRESSPAFVVIPAQAGIQKTVTWTLRSRW
jgi:hypothetical protein